MFCVTRARLLAARTDKQLRGDELENRVVRLFKRLGKWNVKKDVTLIDKYGPTSS